MGKRKTPSVSGDSRQLKPAMTPEAREDQLIALAYNLVEQRLRDGSATSQETTHFLKMGSRKAREEIEKLKRENELLVAKTEAIQSGRHIEELYANAIAAMQIYSGQEEQNDQDVF